MKMIIAAIIGLIALALAEPPVGIGYAGARSDDNGHHHVSSHQRSQEQEADLHGALSQTYLPAARVSQEYGAPASRGLSQKYDVPDARSIPSHEYGAPNARSSTSQRYDSSSLDSSDSYPAGRSPSSQYGVPELQSTHSGAFGAPAQRSFSSAPFPTQKYGIPRGSSSRRSQFRSNTVSQGYSSPSAKNNDIFQGNNAPRNSFKSTSPSRSPSQIHSAPRNAPSQTYGAPASRSLSTSYGAPNARSSELFSQGGKSVSQSYGPPSQGEQADTIEVVSARGLSQHQNTLSHAANLKTDAVASSYAAMPHATIGTSVQEMPAEQYGVPQQYSAHKNQGYEYTRAGLDEQLEEEEASYDFAYKVDDYESESDFGHQETREDNKVEGSYFVVLPDGTKQTVEYEADEDGFRPRISLERSDVSAWTGYDENAQELTDSAGPY